MRIHQGGGRRSFKLGRSSLMTRMYLSEGALGPPNSPPSALTVSMCTHWQSCLYFHLIQIFPFKQGLRLVLCRWVHKQWKQESVIIVHFIFTASHYQATLNALTIVIDTQSFNLANTWLFFTNQRLDHEAVSVCPRDITSGRVGFTARTPMWGDTELHS